MISSNYISEKFFRFVEKIRNRHNVSKNSLTHYGEPLWPWCGIEHIHLSPEKTSRKNKLIAKYTALKGEVAKIKIHNEFQISYDDHVSRIKTQSGYLSTANFTRPQLSADQYSFFNILKSDPIPEHIKKLGNEYPQLKAQPQPFDYAQMEQNSALSKPVCVGLPSSMGENFILNEQDEITQNVLHLPIKISRSKADELKREGRIIKDNAASISHMNVYLPKELSSLSPLIEYITRIECEYNPYFLEDYYIFLSVSHSLIAPGDTQRRGGWHIDGHQGSERLQRDGKKLPCDRQYMISNINPTQYIEHTFNFEKVRDYCKKKFCSLDSVNMQDVIEYQAAKQEIKNPASVDALPINQLVFLNPYMVHRASTNKAQVPVKRTFVRILCSSFTRNRLGDSINPILGPLYPMKVKTIVDVHEIADEFK